MPHLKGWNPMIMVPCHLQIVSLNTHPFSIRLACSINAQLIPLRDMQGEKAKPYLEYILIPTKMKCWSF